MSPAFQGLDHLPRYFTGVRVTWSLKSVHASSYRCPYKEPFSVDKSPGIIEEGRGGHFQSEVVDAFLDQIDATLEQRERFADGATESAA